MRRPFLACVLLAASGCAAIAGFEELEFTSSPVTDGGSEGSPPVDSSIDSKPSDGSMPIDAGRDRNAPIGCEAGTYDFCADFEQVIVVGDGGWTEELKAPPSSFTRVNGEL